MAIDTLCVLVQKIIIENYYYRNNRVPKQNGIKKVEYILFRISLQVIDNIVLDFLIWG